MTNDMHALSERVSELGKRIEKQLEAFSADGVAHAKARQAALDMQMKHARLEALAKAQQKGAAHAERDAAIASEIEVTLLSIEQWLAGIDKGY